MADANCARETVLDLVDSLKKYSSHLIASEYFNEDYFLETFDKITPYLAFQIITFNRLKLFRSRASSYATDIENIRQISYPPEHRATKTQRCNSVGQQMLYGSSNIETSLLELDLSDGEPCALVAEFLLKESETLNVLPIGEIDHYRRFDRLRIETPGVLERIVSLLDGLNHWERLAYQYVDAFLADLMLRTAASEQEKKNLYEVTSRIANAFWSNNPAVDGLLYPSVKHQGGINLAVLPHSFDRAFELERVSLTGPIENLGYGLFAFYIHADAVRTTENGDFIWQTRNYHANARSTIPLSAES